MDIEREIKVRDAIKYCIENFDSKTATNRIVEFWKDELELQQKQCNIANVSGAAHLHCVLNPHYDNKGRLDGGTIISSSKITGHIDPSGEEGCPGVDGITDYGYDGVRTDR